MRALSVDRRAREVESLKQYTLHLLQAPGELCSWGSTLSLQCIC
ncbi:hypothetical protein Hanom_Chr16g01493441 [Helianthus anomalus]